MLERLRTFARAKHHKSGREFSVAQKLVLFMGFQRRQLRGARAMLERVGLENPTIKLQIADALRSIAAVEDALESEYQRDREALKQHNLQELEDLAK